jgi:hypothetical protein
MLISKILICRSDKVLVKKKQQKIRFKGQNSLSSLFSFI